MSLRLLASAISVLVLAIILWLIISPGPIDAAAFHPDPPIPLSSRDAASNQLKQAELLALGQVYGPEDVAVDARGYIYAGTQDGKIIRFLPGSAVQTFAVTGGRPLGLQFDHQGNLIVCDAWKGLLSISPAGNISVLATQARGRPFQFTNDLDIASNGDIYFSDSSRFHQPDYMLDALEARAHGRLLRYRPGSGDVEQLADGLYFANGVALSQDESFVIVNETFRYRISRYWLKGEKQGEMDIFADHLPGFPDGATADRQGTFWVAMPTLRNPQLDRYHSLPWLKNIIARLPRSLAPQPARYGLVMAFDEAGNIITSLHDSDGSHLQEITAVEPIGRQLYLGSLHNDRIGRYTLP